MELTLRRRNTSNYHVNNLNAFTSRNVRPIAQIFGSEPELNTFVHILMHSCTHGPSQSRGEEMREPDQEEHKLKPLTP